MEQTINLLLVDDHKVVRDGVKALLSSYGKLKVVAECDDGTKALDCLEHHDIDLILMDISMKNLNGIDTTKLLKKIHPDTKIIGLTMHHDKGYFQSMIDVGADGFVLKSIDQDELAKAIMAVMDGKVYFCKELQAIS